MSDIGYLEAIVVGALQGVSELFPVSSLGHSILLPALAGGRWAHDLDMTAPGSPYLAMLVAMHVATAIALTAFYRRDWAGVITGLISSIRERRIRTPYQRLAWLLIAGTVPVGVAGLALDRLLRDYLGKPIPVALFLTLNGILLYTVERLQQRVPEIDPDATAVLPRLRPGDPTTPMAAVLTDTETDSRLASLTVKDALVIGAAQILALFPGISRSGATIGAGLLKGLRHEDAARFAFLLATPVIAAAGVLKMPELFQPQVQGSLGPALVGSLVAGIASWIAVRFLTSYFHHRTMTPFALYCVLAGVGSLTVFAMG
ncbi:undecaprenyl-diphosphate phosphatase [Pseudonocardiaceae bacterium YIM PH 21723]|nr:undecaprenyl-diphosphate phosphatase [Pseudonocardiaceae bacterium YIM PH 21723]